MDDIIDADRRLRAPAEEHVHELIEFVRGWDRARAAGHALLRRHQPLDRGRLHHRLRAQSAAATRRRSRRTIRAIVDDRHAQHHAGRPCRPHPRPRGPHDRARSKRSARHAGRTRANRSGSIWNESDCAPARNIPPRHATRKRGIQYSPRRPISHYRCILNRPPSRTMTMAV